MTTSILQFAQQCLKDIDYEFLTIFDPKRGQEGSFSTYPVEWVERYISQKYYEHDYTLLKNLYLPVVWSEKTTNHMPTPQKKIFQEAQDFHIYQGLTIPFSNVYSREFMTLTFPKKERLTSSKIQFLSHELRIIGQIILSYKKLLENDANESERTLQFIKEVVEWQNQHRHFKNKRERTIDDILDDIKTTQLFIAHHETKDLGLELLHHIYKNIERML